MRVKEIQLPKYDIGDEVENVMTGESLRVSDWIITPHGVRYYFEGVPGGCREDEIRPSAAVPSLDNHTTIKTYKDACEALGESQSPILDFLDPCEAAFVQLKTISKALRGLQWRPEPGRARFYVIFDEEGDVVMSDRATCLCSHPLSLCQQTKEKAIYFGEQFKGLWLQYLKGGQA